MKRRRSDEAPDIIAAYEQSSMSSFGPAAATAADDSTEYQQGPNNGASPASNIFSPGQNKAVFYNGLYAPSGFDMMTILVKVATRPNPKIDIGAIDSNCALILCDTHAPDSPIVYCSEGFETLTGYHKSETIGKNCRFLQFPPSSPASLTSNPYELNHGFGSDSITAPSYSDMKKTPPKEHLLSLRDRESLTRFKTMLTSGVECQITVTNYTKWGMPFTNIVTAIPISWGDSPANQDRYVVGLMANRQNVVFAV